MVQSTFRSALDRMKETPGFCFTASSALFYEWVAENDPAMLAEIKERVKEGRWNLVGGWWVEPDVNMPSGEALARQGLYGQLSFRRLFGRTAKAGFNPDSFGHAGTLPQILKLQGLDNYVFMRPRPALKTLPANIFWWEGPDGSRVLAYRIPISYNDRGSVRKRLLRVLKQFRKEPVHNFMVFYGAGDHGGGATKTNIQSIEQIQSETGAPELLFSTVDRYFREIRSAAPKLPVVKEDLQHHAVGCYTADSEIKKGNRAAETALVTAEKLAAVGAAAWGSTYPKAALTSAWKKVLFLQFHDSLAGTALPEHHLAARQGHDYALEVAHEVMYKAAEKLAWRVPAEDPDSYYLMVFNPHAWEVNQVVEYDLSWNRETPSRVEDERSAALPHQWVAGSTVAGNRNRLVFRTPVPAFGYRQIRLRKQPGDASSGGVRASTQALENEHLRIRFTPDGTIGILDKDTGKEVFRGGATGARGVILNDPSDTWSHEVRSYSEEIGAFANASTKVVESGPLRGRVRVRSGYGASTLTVDWLLCAGSRRLEARVALEWHEHRKMLKFSFPVDVETPRATYEVPYGHIVRDTEGDENPGQRWIDLTGQRTNGAYGLAVINDAKYGYSVMGNDMRISIARGAPYAHHQPRVLKPGIDYHWQDQGKQTFRILLAPHQGSWREAGIARLAEEFVTPPVVIFQGIHTGSRPQADSFLEVDNPQVVIGAIKQAEDGEDLIVRCVETAGRAASASIELRFANCRWSGRFHPSEIKTLRLNPETGKIREVNLLEE